MTLYEMARDNLSVEELESILEEKKKMSQPRELTLLEKYTQMHYKHLTEGDKPKLYPPKYK